MSSSGQPKQGVFISYARSDGEAEARALHGRLRADAPDVPAWLDRLELEGGVGWWSQIERELDRAEFLVIVMTPAAMQSANTRREWRAARQRGVCVYPVKSASYDALDDTGLPNWMRKAHFYDPVLEWPKLVAHLRRGCQATRVPFMAPSTPDDYIERPRESRALIERLLGGDASTARLVALRGGGGYGKTRLAAAVCHQDAVIEAFDDGILWATLGQAPNLLNELIKLYAALTGERPGFVDVEDAARELALKLGSKNCLIVLDDVWKSSHAQPFLCGAPGCAWLITSRLGEVVPDARRVLVEQMEPQEALDLLLARLGRRPVDLRPWQALVTRLHEWPLPIKLVGSALRQRIERGDTDVNALSYVTRALDKRGLVAFDEPGSSERSTAVGRTIELSLAMLEASERRHCEELAVFAEKAEIPIAVAGSLWQLDEIDSEDLARRLDDLALLEFDLRQGTVRLHDVLRGYLAARLCDPAAVHGRLLGAWGDAYRLPNAYAWRAYAYHLHAAGRTDELGRLLLDIDWLKAKLEATGIHALITDYDRLPATPALEAVRDALRLSAPALAGAPGELRSQLYGRLLASPLPELELLLRNIGGSRSGPWLRPCMAALDAPGGMLQLTLARHSSGVRCLSADAEWTRLVSGANDGSLRVWDLADGKPVTEIKGLSRLGVRGVAIAGADSRVLVGTAEGRLHRVDLVTGEALARLVTDDRSAIRALAVSSDGSIAISASRDGKARVWDLRAEGKAEAPPHADSVASAEQPPFAVSRVAMRAVQVPGERISCVALAGDGACAVTGSDEGGVQVWETRTATLRHRMSGHRADVNCVAVTRDGRLAVSGSSDRSLMLWDLERGVRLHGSALLAASVTAVAIAADANRLVAGLADGSAHLVELPSTRVLATLGRHADSILALAIDAAGRRAASASADGSIKLWRLDPSAAAPAVLAHSGAVTSLVISPDGALFASGGADGRILVRERQSGRLLQELAGAHSAPVRSLAFSDDSSCVLSGGIDGSYRLWSIESGERFALPVRHLAPIGYCAMSPAARYLVTTCPDHFVYVWEVPSGFLIARYGTRRLFDHLIAPAPQRRHLPATDELLDAYLPGETVFDVVIVRMSADGRNALLSATVRDSSILRGTKHGGGAPSPVPDADAGQFREAAPGQRAPAIGSCLLVFELATGGVRSVTSSQGEAISAFAIDRSACWLLWARSDHKLELWDLLSAQPIALLEGHTAKVSAIAFGDGLAYSCSSDRTLRVWDLAAHSHLSTFTADAALRSLAVAADGVSVVAGDSSGRVHSLELLRPRS